MPLTLEVSMQGYNNLRDLKSELEHIPTREPEAVLAWSKEHPESAWAHHLARHGDRVMVEYVRQLIAVVVVIDQPCSLPKRVEVAVLPSAGKPRESHLHRNVHPVAESVRRKQLLKFFRSFAPLRLVYAGVPELQSLFAEAERVRKAFNIIS